MYLMMFLLTGQMQLWHWQAQMGGPGQQPTHLDPMQGPQIHLVMALCQH
jgi:hypothetical protein